MLTDPLKSTNYTEAYNAGWNAFETGEVNPYSVGTIEHQRFNEGFEAAQEEWEDDERYMRECHETDEAWRGA